MSTKLPERIPLRNKKLLSRCLRVIICKSAELLRFRDISNASKDFNRLSFAKKIDVLTIISRLPHDYLVLRTYLLYPLFLRFLVREAGNHPRIGSLSSMAGLLLHLSDRVIKGKSQEQVDEAWGQVIRHLGILEVKNKYITSFTSTKLFRFADN